MTKAEIYKDRFYTRDAQEARAISVITRRIVREFGDPEGGLGHVDPYEDVVSVSVPVFVAQPREPRSTVNFPTFMPDVARRVARENGSSAQR